MKIEGNYNWFPNYSGTVSNKGDKQERHTSVATLSSQDTVEQSDISRIMASTLKFDKGTASNTTLHVDHATFQKIASYSTYHPDTKWSELGVDENKRWVVINGQRFESEKSDEEKAMMKRAQMTLIDYLQELDEKQKETSVKEKVTLDFLNDHEEARTNQHPKIKNLLENEKVMEMLKNISRASKGKITISF